MKRAFLAVFVLCIVAACGGGGGGGSSAVPPSKQPTQTTGKAAITIVVPNSAKSASALRTPKYIVPGTQSVAIQVISVDGVTPNPPLAPTIAQIGPGAPGCTTISTGVSCTINVNVPYATSLILQISSFSSTDGSGTPLAVGTLGPIDSTQPNPTPFPVALGGVIGSLVVAPTATSPPVSTSGLQTFTFTVTAEDSSGNIILPPGSYSSPITFAATNNASGAISFSPSTLTVPPATGINTISLTFDPSRGFTGSSTISVTASSVSASMTFTPQGSGGGGLTIGPRIFEYSIPSANSGPYQITTDPGDKSLWFTEHNTNKIGKLFTSTCTQSGTPTCSMIEGALTQPIAPTGIARGLDGNVWIGGNTTSTVTGHVITLQETAACSGSSNTNLNGCMQFVQPEPSPSSGPGQQVNDVRFDTSDSLVSTSVSGSNPGIYEYSPVFLPATFYYQATNSSITNPFALSGNGWVTDPTTNNLGQIFCTEGCSISVYPFVTSPSTGAPTGIAADANGNLYVADQSNNTIVAFNPSSCSVPVCTYTPYAIPTAGSMPEFLTLGPDGNIWFTESAKNKIGILRLSASTPTIVEIPIPTTNATPFGITVGPDGNVWFTELNSNKIGVVVP